MQSSQAFPNTISTFVDPEALPNTMSTIPDPEALPNTMSTIPDLEAIPNQSRTRSPTGDRINMLSIGTDTIMHVTAPGPASLTTTPTPDHNVGLVEPSSSNKNPTAQISILLSYALQSLEEAVNYGERFRLYKEYIEGLPCTHRAEFFEGLSERLLGADETLSSIATIHKNYLDGLTESDYLGMGLTQESFSDRVQYKSISELNIRYLAAEKKKDNHRIRLKRAWGEGWEARFGGLLPDDPNEGLLWRLARFADGAGKGVDPDVLFQRTQEIIARRSYSKQTSKSKLLQRVDLVHLTAYFNQAATVDRESPAGHDEDEAASHDEGEATVINHSPPRKRVILANVVVPSTQRQRRRKPTNTARTRLPIDRSYQPSTRRRAAPSYFLDFSLTEFNPAVVKNNINAIQKTQDDKDEKTRENAEIAAQAVTTLLANGSNDEVPISREQILARLEFLSHMLAGPPPAMQIQEVTVDENADEENADEENANEENADEENADEENADEENADKENTNEDADEENANEENADEENADEENTNEDADEENADEENADEEENANANENADETAVDENTHENVEA